MYSKAFNLMGKGLVPDRYNAAWSMANNKDSAFAGLFRIVQKGTYDDVDHIEYDSDFRSLHADKRWAEVVAVAKEDQKRKAAEPKKKTAL